MHRDIQGRKSTFPYDSTRGQSRGKTLVFWLLVAGLSMIFMSLIAGILYHWIGNDFFEIQLPLIFYFNTLTLGLTGYLVEWSRNRFRSGRAKGLSALLWGALATGILFMAGQVWGWYHMLEHLNIPPGDMAGAFMYLLSGVHLFHLVLVLPFHLYFTFDLQNNMQSLGKDKKYLERPDRRLMMELIRNYWHFLGLVWVLLFFLLLSMQWTASMV